MHNACFFGVIPLILKANPNNMKNRLLLALLLCACLSAQAQFYKSFVPSPGFTSALQKIVLDFRLDYKNIQGELLLQQGESENYSSAVQLPGAKDCLIYRFHSPQDTTSGWQALMYQGDNYDDAVKAYKNLFRLVRKSQMSWIDRSAVHFVGEMDEPTEDRRFAVSTLLLDVNDKRYTRFVAEIELSGNMGDWAVKLNMHNKRRDTDE
jgi:hypothetical protein